MNKRNSVLISVIVLVLLGLALAFSASRSNNQPGLNMTPVTPTSSVTQTTSQGTRTNNQVVTSTNAPQVTGFPSPTTSEVNIRVSTPLSNSHVGASFSTSGQARVFENTFHVRVTKPSTGAVLFDTSAMANAPDVGQFGSFSVPIDISGGGLTNGDRIMLEVFQFSAKDGSEIDKVSIPLIYSE